MNRLNGIKRLLKYIKNRKTIYLLFFMAVVVSILELVPPQLVGKLVDILPKGEMEKAFFYIAMFGLIYILSSVIKIMYGNLVMKLILIK